MDTGKSMESKISELPGDVNDFCRYRLKLNKAFNACNDKAEFVTSLMKIGTKSTAEKELDFPILTANLVNSSELNTLSRPRRVDWNIPNYSIHKTISTPEGGTITLHCPSLFPKSVQNMGRQILSRPVWYPPPMSISSAESSLVDNSKNIQTRISNINPIHLNGGILIAPKEAKQEIAHLHNHFEQPKPNEPARAVRVKAAPRVPVKRKMDKMINQILKSGRKVESSRDHIFKFVDKAGRVCYQCAICLKGFGGQLANIKVHLRIHTGEKPYGCKVCGRHFRQSAHLKNHLFVHSGQRHYECKICHKRLSRRVFLKSHMKLHESDPSTDRNCNS